jgi:hypothetical protein
MGVTVVQIVVLMPTTASIRLRNQDSRWKQDNGREYDTILEIKDDRAVVLETVEAAGQFIFKDSKLVGLDMPAPVRERCHQMAPVAL